VIPIFDALSHPTVSGRWLDSAHDARIEPLLSAMKGAGYGMACAVGLAGVGDYTHEGFAAMCRPHAELVPIAGIDPRAPDLELQLDAVRELGFRGIKLHPRFSKFALDDESFVSALAGARDRDLVVMLCTYAHGAIASYPVRDPLYALVSSLKRVPGVRLVLLHGGDVDLMRWAQLARHEEHLLLDVSYTMMKYRGSSLDADLRFLLSSFHRRVCVGVDHPEYDHASVRERFEELTDGFDGDARRDVGYRSLARFLRVDAAWE
jgi:predicted TIM-barrel fold metal-dependent hydrolase